MLERGSRIIGVWDILLCTDMVLENDHHTVLETFGNMDGGTICHIILELEDKENFICALFSFLVCILGGVLEFIWPAEFKTSPTCLI